MAKGAAVAAWRNDKGCISIYGTDGGGGDDVCDGGEAEGNREGRDDNAGSSDGSSNRADEADAGKSSKVKNEGGSDDMGAEHCGDDVREAELEEGRAGSADRVNFGDSCKADGRGDDDSDGNKEPCNLSGGIQAASSFGGGFSGHSLRTDGGGSFCDSDGVSGGADN